MSGTVSGRSGHRGECAPGWKILGRREILARFSRPREGRLVFTNGCFDLLHRGHVEFLFQAASLGDQLVVGLNTDASVRRLKGAGRPLVDEDDRAIVVAALECVDAVTLFDEDTPLALVEALLPDTLVKGGDYDVGQVVGRREVENGGGETVVLPYHEGYSTSELLRRARKLPEV